MDESHLNDQSAVNIGDLTRLKVQQNSSSVSKRSNNLHNQNQYAHNHDNSNVGEIPDQIFSHLKGDDYEQV